MMRRRAPIEIEGRSLRRRTKTKRKKKRSGVRGHRKADKETNRNGRQRRI